MSWEIMQGDVREQLKLIPEKTIQTCVTSPPYFGLRDYGTAKWDGGDPDCDHKSGKFERGGLSTKQKSNYGSDGDEAKLQCPKCGALRVDNQIGLESTPEEYVETMVDVFREVKRVLRDDGTVWLNLGDSYYGGGWKGSQTDLTDTKQGTNAGTLCGKDMKKDLPHKIIKTKDLVGIPWMVAFALRADGWYLRSDIIWHKRSPMPESVTDRPTKAHEYIFLLSKNYRYFYDAEAIRESPKISNTSELGGVGNYKDGKRHNRNFDYEEVKGANKRSVWTVSTRPYPGAHFATFPPNLIEPCILAGSSPKSCEICGSPWVRTIKINRPENYMDSYEDKDKDYLSNSGRRGGWEPRSLSSIYKTSTSTSREFVGWESTCKCSNEGLGRCKVLDPFAGSGTTLFVSEENNRDSVGIELNPEYVKLIEKRMSEIQPRLIF